ncbi:hypothetical protein [Tautonia plasticadhaerens]|uniref:hypothetical protein n=1 Tax=Tautonia plasticadhaerens TaxID=2527974 RepID=UPI0011A6BDFC|nr:hypothetical protein [Tautonia plasticadhaerens]
MPAPSGPPPIRPGSAGLARGVAHRPETHHPEHAPAAIEPDEEAPAMETFDPKILRKLFRHSPRVNTLFDQTRAALRAERVANPPGPGNLRDLKAQADKDAMHQTYQTVSSDSAYARDAAQYNVLFKKDHGDVAVRP